jgi:hypothetical protein
VSYIRYRRSIKGLCCLLTFRRRWSARRTARLGGHWAPQTRHPTSFKEAARTTKKHSADVGCPTDYQNWHVILVQRWKLNALPCGGQDEAHFRSPCIPRHHQRGQEICAFSEETRDLCARGIPAFARQLDVVLAVIRIYSFFIRSCLVQREMFGAHSALLRRES